MSIQTHKPDYSELDDALVCAIATNTAREFNALSSLPAVKNAAKTLEMASPRDVRGERKPAWRFIDTRLQALRKRGLLTYDRKNGWSAA